jgi:hypothetical protein
VTTASYRRPSRLWRLRFDDGSGPERGGTISMLLDGNEGHRMFDNLTINPGDEPDTRTLNPLDGRRLRLSGGSRRRTYRPIGA